MSSTPPGPPIKLRRFESMAEFETAYADILRDTLQIPGEQKRAMIISGGRTPLKIYERVSAAPFPVNPDAWLAFSDDRHVPLDSPDNNYGNACGMLEALDLGEDRVLRVHTEIPLDDAARRYDRDLRHFLGSGGSISVAMLGLGPDGHTCSLFSQSDLDRSEGRYAIPVEKSTLPHRISITPSVLQQANRIIFAVAGEDKREIARQLLADPSRVIAGRAVNGCRGVELWQV